MVIDNSGFEKEGVAQATVGDGTITTGSDTSGLNRDETQSMLVTKNERTGGLDGSITVDNMLLTNPKEYMESVVSGFKNTTPQKVSRDIEKETGEAPNLGMGIFMKDKNGDRVEPNTGLNSQKLQEEGGLINTILYYTVSDKSIPMTIINQLIPGSYSASNSHDDYVDKNTIGDKKVADTIFNPLTIPQVFYYNYYGALGTYINKVVPSKDENAKVDNK